MFKNILLIPVLLFVLSIFSITQATVENTDSEQIQVLNSLASDALFF